MKVLISLKTGSYYYYKVESNQDLHTKEGVVKKEDILSGENKILAHTGRKFLVFDANPYDLTQKIKRGPQIITLKDLGYIAARCGINKDSLVMEAGGGSGGATMFFAGIVKKVKTYEIKEEHVKIIEKNLKLMNLTNVELITGDLGDYIGKETEKFDLLLLDMPDPQEILKKDLSSVKSGSYVVCYVPSVTQIIDVMNTIKDIDELYFEEVSEISLRHWKVNDKIARPEFRKEIDHTAFLVFIRKI